MDAQVHAAKADDDHDEERQQNGEQPQAPVFVNLGYETAQRQVGGGGQQRVAAGKAGAEDAGAIGHQIWAGPIEDILEEEANLTMLD